MEDGGIIDLFFERSERAVHELSEKYGRLCKTVAHRILGDERDEEECVNDAYLGVWNSIPPQRPDRLPAYLCRIVRNLSVKKYRSNTAIKRNGAYDLALDELEGCLPGPNTAEQTLEERALSQTIDAFLASLDGKSRVMFVRRYWFSDSIPDIADMFGITGHNASVRLSRIRAKMKRYLEKEGVFL